MGPRILLVEDESLVARTIIRTLRGFADITWRTTVAEAMSEVRADCRWDALIVDVGLPDGSGLELVEAARSTYPGLPMLVCSGDVTPDRVNESFRLGARIVSKPLRHWMIRSLIDNEYKAGLQSLIIATIRYPDRWDEGLISYAINRLDSDDWRRLTADQWPNVLDNLDRDLSAALPPDLAKYRAGGTVH